VEAQSELLAGLAGVDVERAGLGTGSSQDRNLVAQHEQLDVLGRCRAAEQHQPSEEPTQDQVEQAERHAAGSSRERGMPIAAGHRDLADFWNPTGSQLGERGGHG
jgi:hypothetical protein